MEDLEKESCGCCDTCNCGENCNCTTDNRCSENCTCAENNKGECNCTKQNEKCNCDSDCKCDDNCNCGTDCKCDDDCTCGEDCACDDENKCSDNCTCNINNEEDCACCDKCDCEEDCICDDENKCDENCTCDKDCDEDDDKCKCGCGESVDEEQESVADAHFKQLLNLRAEFDNYRKRTQSDISKAYSNGFNQAITEFLPALDSFKMASEYITDPNTLVGIQYIEKGILSTLEKMGVKAIDVSGKFDPNFHQAIGSEESAEHESGDIIKECFKGFILGYKVIRYSQVIVAT